MIAPPINACWMACLAMADSCASYVVSTIWLCPGAVPFTQILRASEPRFSLMRCRIR